MRGLAGAVLIAIVAGGGAARSSDLCPALAQLAAQVDPLPPAFATATRCGQVMEPDGPVSFCYWHYPYRSDAAAEARARLEADLTACGGVAEPGSASGAGPAESRVNHPDSYRIRQFRIGTLSTTVSLKDKAAANRTLLFLRVGQR